MVVVVVVVVVSVPYVLLTLILFHTITVVYYLRIPDPFTIPALHQHR